MGSLVLSLASETCGGTSARIPNTKCDYLRFVIQNVTRKLQLKAAVIRSNTKKDKCE